MGQPLFRMWQDSKYDVTVFHRGDDLTQFQAFVDFIYASNEPGAKELQKEIDRQEGRHILEY